MPGSRAEAVDADEEIHFGQNIRGDELPKELRFREERLKKIREAKAALEAEGAEQGLNLGLEHLLPDLGRPRNE